MQSIIIWACIIFCSLILLQKIGCINGRSLHVRIIKTKPCLILMLQRSIKNIKSNLIGVDDFQWLFNGIYPAIKEGKVDDLYQVFSNDFLYKDPMNNVIFLDNHDMTRFYSETGEDFDKLKMGIGCLLTQRGI